MSAPILIEKVRILDPSRDLDETGSVLLENGRIVAAGAGALNQGRPEGTSVVSGEGLAVIPGLVDLRVFMGEPGYEHRETIASVSRAAAAGGVTTILTMPDTNPVIDDVAIAEFVMRTARDTAVVNVHPAAALTRGLKGMEMTEIGLLRRAGVRAFCDGRETIADSGLLRRIMTYARDFDALVMHETRDASLAGAGVMNEGLFASWLGLPGVPAEAEIIPLERDLRLAALTGCRYHATQISLGASAEVVRRAKAGGNRITAAASINHLCLNEIDVGEYRTYFRLSPPLRAEEDRLALVEALADGTVDIIVSSHDPQDADGKRRPFAEAHSGAIGLETLLPAALRLVNSGMVTLQKALSALTVNPARLMGLDAGTLAPGSPADLALVDLSASYRFTEDMIRSRSKNTTFENALLEGRVLQTFVGGQSVFEASVKKG